MAAFAVFTVCRRRAPATPCAFAMLVLTFEPAGALFARRAPDAVRLALRVLAVVLAITAVFFVIRAGHLGAKLAWGEPLGGQQRGG